MRGLRQSYFRMFPSACRIVYNSPRTAIRCISTPVLDSFADDIDYAQLVKVFGADPEGARAYSPAQCLGIKKEAVLGSPDPKHISTSFVERQNLNLRRQNRRFTRLTNAFSKKIKNHIHSLALFHVHNNFARIHQTLRVTPVME